MATRSEIAVLDKEKNTVKSIYCNFDGYLDGVGEILKENYNNLEIVNKLIEKGDIPFLAKRLEELEPYNDVETDKLKYKVFDSIDSYNYYLAESYLDFAYLFKDDKWYYLELINRTTDHNQYNLYKFLAEKFTWKVL
jgi:hypothetical protein